MKRILAIALLICLTACACAAPRNVLAPQPTPTLTPSPTPEPTPTPMPEWQRGEEWFLGDWAGVAADHFFYGEVWEDFSTAVSDFAIGNGCLLRVYETGDGYEAALSSSRWAVTEHSMEGFLLTCTQGTAEQAGYPDSIYFDPCRFSEGQTIRFTYAREAANQNPAAALPEKHLLSGQSDSADIPVHFLLARLPGGEERPWGSGEYPCWFGGYEGMEGDFSGMFCLGVDERGRRLFGQVLRMRDGWETVIEVNDGDSPDFRYGERAAPYEDLIVWRGCEGAAAMFPSLQQFDPLLLVWRDVSEHRKAYFRDVLIPLMETEIAELEQSGRDLWTEREILVRWGYIDYAGKLVRGDFDGVFSMRIPHIPAMVRLDPEYRREAALAGIAPGDTLADAKKLHPLHPLSKEEAARFGIEERWMDHWYTDGRGLLVSLAEDGRVSSVTVLEPGYDTPDGRQTDAPYERNKLTYYATDAVIEYGGWWLEDGVDEIGEITMTMVLDRVWDETALDIDGDGEPERVTLSGRALGSGPEQPTAICRNGVVEEGIDFGTRTRLSVYKNRALIFERELPLYTFYNFTPRFCDKFQTDVPGDVYIQCETGGTGLEIPVYRVGIDGQAHALEYLGDMDVYS